MTNKTEQIRIIRHKPGFKGLPTVRRIMPIFTETLSNHGCMMPQRRVHNGEAAINGKWPQTGNGHKGDSHIW